MPILALLLGLSATLTWGQTRSKCVPAKDICEAVDFSRKRSKVESETGCFRSAALKRGVCYMVTFPKGYPFAQPAPYVIYLHGYNGTRSELIAFASSCPGVTTDQFFERNAPQFLVFAPDETERTYWKNSVDGRRVHDMVREDLVQHIEQASKNISSGNPQLRGIMGTSMGGHAAFFTALTNPDLFGSMFAMSAVFRDERMMTRPEDREGFGTGERFLANDPVTLFKKQELPSKLNFQMEMASDDGLYLSLDYTKDFYTLLKSRYPNQVFVRGTGGHKSLYWCREALPIAIRFFNEKFKTPANTPAQAGT